MKVGKVVLIVLTQLGGIEFRQNWMPTFNEWNETRKFCGRKKQNMYDLYILFIFYNDQK